MYLVEAALGQFFVSSNSSLAYHCVLHVSRKTTTMLFKMLLIERAHQLSDESQPSPRQMFVTKSRVLAGKVNEHFKTFLVSLSFDSNIDESSSSKNEDPADEENIVHEEDNAKWRNDLPEKFTELEVRHFPLFITFDHVSTAYVITLYFWSYVILALQND
jgi:hypothetical protein